MKKIVFTLLIFMVCTIHALAYEYFTIYFSDGTKSEAFYATDVDSICYSKLSLDGIVYNEWQVQEIYTVDSVYRYLLAQIDSLSFKDVDVNQVAEDIANINCKIMPMYAKCNSTEEISIYIPSILNITGVENAWFDNQSLFVKVRNWGTLTFSYPPIEENEDEVVSLMSRASNHKTAYYTSEYKACIINQMFNDQNRIRPRNAAKKLKSKFEEMGIECYSENKPLAHFFHNGIFDYDLVFIMTHGCHDGQSHWLFTSEELFSTRDVFNEVEYQKLDSLAYDLLNKKYPYYSPNMINAGWLQEYREGKKVIVWYVMISEHYIASADLDYKNRNTAIFNLACQSLKENYNLAEVFLNKGAKCYLGYTETNRIGAEGGESFYNNLLNGKCAYGAYDIIPIERCTESFEGITPLLELCARNTEETLKYHITKPKTQTAETEENGAIIKIKGQIKILNPYGDEASKNSYGLIYSQSPNMDDYKVLERKLDYDEQTHDIIMEYTFKEGELKPNTTYYYCAYMNDGYSDCYGEIMEFTTGGAEAYYVNENGCITFYYDGMREKRRGSKIGKGYLVRTAETVIKKVIFDTSFSNYHPEFFEFAYCDLLEEIVSLKYLRTDSISDMGGMFYGCSSLTSLDLSSFNTSNVTDMARMFSGCSSLKGLDLTNFNTSNVTDMARMFSGCSSLKGLDLTNFNTSNVTDMLGMFSECSSLTSLDLSSFNTSNVTNMYEMFFVCSSLSSLDLSIFNTSNVTDMDSMFSGCSSLTNLDLSSFDTSNVTNMGGMFYGCSSLTSLGLRSFDTSNVTNMLGMFSECSSLRILDISGFDTSKVRDMSYMFSNCSSLKSLDLSNFNTSNVTNMNFMFDGCCSLTSLNLNSFNTSNVTGMRYMFGRCSSLTNLDLSIFNTSNVTDMYGMFDDCSFLATIYAGNWNRNVPNEGMFGGCKSLVGGQGTKLGYNVYGYDSQGNPLGYWCESGSEAARIDGGKDNPGLFTAK